MKAMKEAEEKARAEQRREQAKQKMRERQIRKGISADYLEDNDDDDNSYSLNRIKDQYKRGYGNTPRRDYDSDDEPDRHCSKKICIKMIYNSSIRSNS